MATSADNCTLLVATPDKVALPTQAELQAELESTDIGRKVAALKKVIMLVLGGEDMPRILMAVIRYCITQEDHTLQKLLMLYWEVVRKYDAGGKLLPEMILVCNALRNNLIHPNEYLRGCTLRFLCKLKEPELLEPLVPSIKVCLSHRHPYVRRNAVLAVYNVYRNYTDMYPDAPAEMEKILEEEVDAGTRRNAFIMIFNVSPDKALAFLANNQERVVNFGDGFALLLLDLIKRVARTDSSRKAKFIRVVFSLLDSPSNAVSFEAASSLTALSAAPSAIRAAAGAYIKILNRESDGNVKLIVLERLSALRKRHAKVLREVVMDILRALSTPDNDIRARTLEVAMDLVYPRNVEEVMMLLKKEIVSTGAGDVNDVKYRTMLIVAVHNCAIRFPDVAGTVVHLLLDFLAGDGGLMVIEYVREIVETYPDMRAAIMTKLLEVMTSITAGDVLRVALWLLGQYSESEAEVDAAIHTIRQCVGPIPFITPWADFVAAAKSAHTEAAGEDGKAGGASAATTPATKRPMVLADGTYASQSAASESKAPGKGGRRSSDVDEAEDVELYLPAMRRLLLSGDFYLASVVASTLTKLALRVSEHRGRDARHTKSVMVDAMLVMCALVELGASGLAGTTTLLPASAIPAAGRGSNAAGYRAMAPGAATAAASSGIRIDQDSFERIVLCMQLMGDPTATAAALPVLLHTCRDTFKSLLADRRARAAQAVKDGVASVSATGVAGTGTFATVLSAPASAAGDGGGGRRGAGDGGHAAVTAQVDECLNLRLLRPGRAAVEDAVLEDDGLDTNKAAGSMVTENFSERLKRIHQLTGFADPVYAEAFVKVAEFDVILEVLVINRTDTTLTNVTVELSTMGDLRLVERPPSFTLAPRDSRTVKANIKVASTETGHIFGTIVYDAVGASATGDRTTVINLAEIHVDIIDHIIPTTCSDAAFRSMWADFEWENKVGVNTNITNLQEFVTHIAKQTNMRILTPIATLEGCNFLAANLYARSVFGEDALVNVSIENRPDGSIKGHIRIRAKTQGVALSLGDRITSKQKGSASAAAPAPAGGGDDKETA